MLPGFSDDGESGEEIPGEGMVVLGRGIPLITGTSEGAEETSGTSERPGNGSSYGAVDGSSLLVVSGVKLGDAHNSQVGGEAHGAFEFPGFSSATGQSGDSQRANGQERGGMNINDIPFDFI